MGSPEIIKAVAIDGPAGSGKSTISRIVADKLGYIYIDTGAMYRALTSKVMDLAADLDDQKTIIDIAGKTDIRLEPSKDGETTIKVFLDGIDVSEKIRSLEVTGNVKYIARIPEVRGIMVKKQRQMALGLDGTVMEGRDITTVVLPDARYKIYLDANFNERVERRYLELLKKGKKVSKKDVEDDLRQRDHADTTREVGALKKAKDAYILDTTGLAIDEVVEKIVRYSRKD